MKVKKAAGSILNIVFYLILAFMIYASFAIITATKSGRQPEILGYKFYVVLTGSMKPDIQPGDLIIVKDVSDSEIKKGDVITFKGDNTDNVTTHRVKEIIVENDAVSFITQGDANNIQDEGSVRSELIQGKVMKVVPKIGRTMEYMKNNLAVILSIIVAVFCAVMAICAVFKGLKKKTVKGEN